jgi:hypothetical protein
VRVVDHLTSGFNENAFTIGVFLDVEKAFDRVWHKGLIAKLIRQRFPDCYIRLLASFLTERTFQVSCEGATSTPRDINAGVPQGSTLSPLLYALYTADIPTTLHCEMATFADDTAMFATNKNIRFATIVMRRQLQTLGDWSKKWRIKINPQKSQAVIFTRRRVHENPEMKLLNQDIPYTHQATYLGVLLDRHLTFSTHLQNTALKAHQRITALASILRHPALQFTTRLRIYTAMIRSLMAYACPAWLHAAQGHLRKLQRAQNHALRRLTGHERATRIAQLHEDTDMPMLQQHLQQLQHQFWQRLRNHPDPAVQAIGTIQNSRQTHKTPRLH